MHDPSLNKFRSTISAKTYLRIILKTRNCATVGYTNRSTNNPNLSFHKYAMTGCKILRGKNLFTRTTISVRAF